MLRQVTKYENFHETDPVVTYFWEVLREMATQQRKPFLQFVWARRRLPCKANEFDSPFKIIKNLKSLSRDNEAVGNEPLPSASTCFFSLTLPECRTKEIDSLIVVVDRVINIGKNILEREGHGIELEPSENSRTSLMQYALNIGQMTEQIMQNR